jgi:kynurenine formamidase
MRRTSPPWKPGIRYLTHEREGFDWIKITFGAKEEDLVHSGGKGAAFEEVTAITHSGTHVDAPWHYGPQFEGKPAKKIDELPIEWFFSDGVVLDLRHKKPGEKISAQDLEGALGRIGYVLKPFDIVMIMNGRDRDLGSTEYFEQPGMTRGSTFWLVEQGIKVIGSTCTGSTGSSKIWRESSKRPEMDGSSGRPTSRGSSGNTAKSRSSPTSTRSRARPASRSPASR